MIGELNFNDYMREQQAIALPVLVMVRVIDTEWINVGDRDGKLPAEFPNRIEIQVGQLCFDSIVEASYQLMQIMPIDAEGKWRVNPYFNLMNYAAAKIVRDAAR